MTTDPYDADPQPGDSAETTALLIEHRARVIRIDRAARRKVDREETPAAPPFDIGTVRQMLARPTEPPFQIDDMLPFRSSMLLVHSERSARALSSATWSTRCSPGRRSSVGLQPPRQSVKSPS